MTLDKTIKRYYNEFKFRHPTPNDFKRVAEKVSDIELEWYLNDWTRTTNKVDYEIVSYNPESRGLLIKRKGLIPMPIELSVVFEDLSVKKYYIPIDLTFGSKSFTDDVEEIPVWSWVQPEYRFFVKDNNKKVVRIEIDPSKRMADVDQENNIFIVE